MIYDNDLQHAFKFFRTSATSPILLHPRTYKYTVPLYCPVLNPRATPEWVRETGTPSAFEKYSSMLGDWSLFQGLNMFENSSLETRGSIDPGAVPFPNKNNINLAMSLALLKTQESPQNRVHFLQKSTTFILTVKNADFKTHKKCRFLFRLKKYINQLYYISIPSRFVLLFTMQLHVWQYFQYSSVNEANLIFFPLLWGWKGGGRRFLIWIAGASSLP